MWLQTSKQSSVVMLKVKVLQPQFGVFDGDLMEIKVLNSDLLIIKNSNMTIMYKLI